MKKLLLFITMMMLGVVGGIEPADGAVELDATWNRGNQSVLTEAQTAGVHTKMMTMHVPFIANQG